MTREMDDGINSDAAGIARNDMSRIQLVAGYIDSTSFTWTAADWALFPNKVHVRIATKSSTNDGNVLDVEAGDATPAQAAQWAKMRRASGYAFPTVYCSASAQASVIAAFNAVGESLPLWWLAHYDNSDVLPAGAIAKQYADPGPLDKSIVADVWPGVDTGVIMTNPFTGYSANAPILDANGNYTGKDAPNPTDFADDERFTNASVRWLIEDWVPKVNAALTAIQAVQAPSTLSGSATVTVNLAPPAV